MIFELLDDPEAWFFIVMAAVVAVWLVLRWRHGDRVLDTRPIKSLGAFGGVSLYLVAGSGRRKFLSIEYEEQGEDETRELQVLFSSKQAAALAAHLQVAAFPHASLAYARAATRKVRAGR